MGCYTAMVQSFEQDEQMILHMMRMNSSYETIMQAYSSYMYRIKQAEILNAHTYTPNYSKLERLIDDLRRKNEYETTMPNK